MNLNKFVYFIYRISAKSFLPWIVVATKMSYVDEFTSISTTIWNFIQSINSKKNSCCNIFFFGNTELVKFCRKDNILKIISFGISELSYCILNETCQIYFEYVFFIFIEKKVDLKLEVNQTNLKFEFKKVSIMNIGGGVACQNVY